MRDAYYVGNHARLFELSKLPNARVVGWLKDVLYKLMQSRVTHLQALNAAFQKNSQALISSLGSFRAHIDALQGIVSSFKKRKRRDQNSQYSIKKRRLVY